MKSTFGRLAVPALFLVAGMLVVTAGGARSQPDNMGAETRLRDAAEEARDLDDRADRLRRRIEVTDLIAANLCEERISLTEALESVTAVAHASPDWFEQLRALYPNKLSAREVLARYLVVKIRGMLWTAEALGDVSRAAFLSTRLKCLNDEMCAQLQIAAVHE